MSTKKDRMIQKARRDLKDKETEEPEAMAQEKKTPSFFSGFILMFLGTSASMFALQAGYTLLGLAIGTPFILLGMQRMFKSTSQQFKSKTTV
ncbi:MAG: hypothetical protein INQ03_24630 [Candidatus Heimdallarchaeota archaeon]|nr:hypothetical protein [Candidatus Heimdallarchaeota archaeon]